MAAGDKFLQRKRIMSYISESLIDIVVAAFLISVLLVLSFIFKRDFFAFFREGDFLWTALGVFSPILFYYLCVEKNSFNIVQKINAITCLICGGFCVAIFFTIKMNVAKIETDYNEIIFYSSLGMFLLSEICKIISKIDK